MEIMEKKFSIKQALSYGFSQFFEHAGVIFLAMLVWLSITVGLLVGGIAVLFLLFFSMSRLVTVPQEVVSLGISAYIDSLFSSMSAPVAIIAVLAIIAYSWYVYSLYLGFIRILFDIYEFDSSSVSRLFSCRPIALKAWIVRLLFSIMLMIGFLLLFIPGLFVLAMYGFAQFYLIDRGGGGIFEAFSYSSKLARGAIFELLAYYLIIFIIFSVSTIFPPLWLIMVPSLLLSSVFVYKKLQEQTV